MGRSSKAKNSRRDTTDIANRRLPVYSPVPYSPLPKSVLRDIEDRRTWHPSGSMRPARSFSQSQHRLTTPNVNRRKSMQHKLHTPYVTQAISFDVPEKVAICVRRKMREEVLHALKKTGKRGQKRPRFTWYSKIACRR